MFFAKSGAFAVFGSLKQLGGVFKSVCFFAQLRVLQKFVKYAKICVRNEKEITAMEKIILDTDMGCDCDDVGALALACGAHKRGEAELLGVTHAIDNPYGLRFIEKMLAHYNVDVPLGKCSKKDFLNEERFNTFIKPLADGLPEKEHPDSVKLMREILSKNRGVTLVTIGSFVNVAALLASGADEISSLDGKTLVAQSVTNVYSMAGHFTRPDYAEFNIVCDIPAARSFVSLCPVPVVYCGFEVGEKIFTGAHLRECTENPLLHDAYGLYTGRECGNAYLRPSWDPATVYTAIYQDENELFDYSDPVTVTFDEKGKTRVVPDGKDLFLTLEESPDTAAEVLNKLMR